MNAVRYICFQMKYREGKTDERTGPGSGQGVERLKALGVQFSLPPTTMGTAKPAVFDDTCGNNIQIFQVI